MTLNGSPTSDRVLDPGFTNYAKTVLYTADDVTRLVRQQQGSPAPNVIATQLGSGQFDDETTSNDWHWEDAEWRATPRLRMDLYIRYADGTEQLVRSDDTWKVSVAGPGVRRGLLERDPDRRGPPGRPPRAARRPHPHRRHLACRYPHQPQARRFRL
jgi:alpha-L-rhamnosidase